MLSYLEECFESYSSLKDINLIVQCLVDEFELITDEELKEMILDAIQIAVTYNDEEDIPRLLRLWVLSFRSVGVQSPTAGQRFFESPLLVKSRALKKIEKIQLRGGAAAGLFFVAMILILEAQLPKL